jgi:hypothetical protein
MKQPPAAALEPKQSRASSVAVRARPQAVRRGELTLTTIGKLRLMALPRAPVRTSAAADALHAASTGDTILTEDVRVAADVLDVRDGRHIIVPLVAQEEVVGEREHGAVRTMS